MRLLRYFTSLVFLTIFCIQNVQAQKNTYPLESFLKERILLWNHTLDTTKSNNTLQKPHASELVSSVDTSFWEGNISLSFRVPEVYGEQIFPANYFITEPSGLVRSINFSGSFVSDTGFLLPGKQANLNITIRNEGRYSVSVPDIYGFSILKKDFQIGSIQTAEEESAQIIDPLLQINTLREALWGSILEWNTLLQKIAKEKIEDMIEKKYFGHSDLEGNNFIQNISNTSGMMLGENLVRSTDKSLLQKALESSPAHRYNMQFPEWNQVGIATMKWPDDMWYMVQIFGK